MQRSQRYVPEDPKPYFTGWIVPDEVFYDHNSQDAPEESAAGIADPLSGTVPDAGEYPLPGEGEARRGIRLE